MEQGFRNCVLAIEKNCNSEDVLLLFQGGERERERARERERESATLQRGGTTAVSAVLCKTWVSHKNIKVIVMMIN